MPGKTSLSDFQTAISQAVMRPLAAGDFMSSENRGTANQFIKPNDRLTSSDRLQIYNQQYWWRLLGSFSEDFSGLRSVLGARKFDKLAVSYLKDCGSMSWNLRDLGSHLTGYLREHPELTAPLTQLAIDMAAVEWARTFAFDGDTKPLLNVEKFSSRKPEKMTLGLQPYLALLELNYPVDKMLGRLIRLESDPASNAVSAEKKSRPIRLTAKPSPSPIYLAVHRLDLLIYYKRLEPEAFHLLQELRNGHCLESACEIAFSKSAEPAEAIAAKVQTWFAAWMSFGWLCDR